MCVCVCVCVYVPAFSSSGLGAVAGYFEKKSNKYMISTKVGISSTVWAKIRFAKRKQIYQVPFKVRTNKHG